MQYLIIYNPHAANDAAGKKVDKVKRCLAEAGLGYTIAYTEHAGHAVELAAGMAGNYDVVVAAGGDGTTNEVLNGMMQHKSRIDSNSRFPAFGVLCTGRGNDFAYSAGVPNKVRDGCAALRENRRKWIDIGCITGPEVDGKRYFGNGIGIGFDTIVGLEAAKLTWAQGFLGYFLGALKTIFFYFRAPVLSIETDSFKETKPSILISVMNGRRMGGAFYMAPESRMDDGEFDLCIGGDPTRRNMIRLIPKFLKGTQAGDPDISFSRSSKVVVESADGMLVVHADGETICTEGKRIELEVVPKAVEVIYGV